MKGVYIKDLTFSYADKKIIEDMNLKINIGEFVCILGTSGCGKSTLLRLIAGLEKPTKGSIYVNDKEIKGAGLDRALVFQDYSLFPWLTVGGNIEIALEQVFENKKKKEIKQIAQDYLNKVGLGSEYNTFPKDLSGGMKQRVAIARAFAIDSPILLMDEPFGALDIITRRKLQNILLKMWELSSQKIVLFVTHDIEEAVLLSQKIIILRNSKEAALSLKLIERKEGFTDDNLLRKYLIDNLEDNVS